MVSLGRWGLLLGLGTGPIQRWAFGSCARGDGCTGQDGGWGPGDMAAQGRTAEGNQGRWLHRAGWQRGTRGDGCTGQDSGEGGPGEMAAQGQDGGAGQAALQGPWPQDESLLPCPAHRPAPCRALQGAARSFHHPATSAQQAKAVKNTFTSWGELSWHRPVPRRLKHHPNVGKYHRSSGSLKVSAWTLLLPALRLCYCWGTMLAR